jgi:copper chaperone CopZ
MSVLRLWTNQSGPAEGIRLELSRQKGVSHVDVDLLKRLILVEYDPNEISIEQIRAIIGGPEKSKPGQV